MGKVKTRTCSAAQLHPLDFKRIISSTIFQLVKALLHEAISIFPATWNATDDDSIARQIAEYVGATTYLTSLRKVEDQSTFPATRNAIFRC